MIERFSNPLSETAFSGNLTGVVAQTVTEFDDSKLDQLGRKAIPLVAVKTPSEALELWTGHAKKQFEAFTAWGKELTEITQRVATDTVEPIKANASKLFKPAA